VLTGLVAAHTGRRSRLLAPLLVAATVGLLGLLSTGPAAADAAPPWSPGDAVGEPTGAVAQVAITQEDLSFDLRPLADAKPVSVKAVYQLRNDGPAVNVTLDFLADGALEASGVYTVALDGGAVAADETTLPADQVPAAWLPPTITPSLGGQGPFDYPTEATCLGSDTHNSSCSIPICQFTLAIPTGGHTLAVSYQVQPTSYYGAGSRIVWQLGYILAPARQWESFGDLALTVTVPNGWLVATNPSLTRSGDTLFRDFPSLPGNDVAISAEYPRSSGSVPLGPWLVSYWRVILALLLGTVLVVVLIARLRPNRWDVALSPAIPTGCAWGLVAFAAYEANGSFIAPASQTVPATYQSCSGCTVSAILWGVFSAVFLGIAAFGVGVLIAAVTGVSVVAACRLRRRHPPSPPGLPSVPAGSDSPPAS
jgi:hypothetical protein